MPLRTRRWNDPGSPDDGLRILVCRYRPRGLPKGKETWDEWRKDLGPSPELLAAFYGKRGATPLSWPEYRRRYLSEMRARTSAIEELARRVAAGEAITLLCSSACTDAARCHRTLLSELIEARVSRNRSSSDSEIDILQGPEPFRDRPVEGGSMALWFFQRTAPGNIRRIPLPSMQRFLAGERALEHDGDGYVRCIGMAVELRNRKPAAVRRVWFSKIRVGNDGRVDPEHRPRILREATAAGRRGHGPVVHAAHRFAERRLAHLAEWRPEESDLQALRHAVNGRAGKEMI
jgi:uncharacterized protein YeaO (DUF488 family)